MLMMRISRSALILLPVLAGLSLAACSNGSDEPPLLIGDGTAVPPAPVQNQNFGVTPVVGAPVGFSGSGLSGTQLAQLPPAPSTTLVGERASEIRAQYGNLEATVARQTQELDALRQRAADNASVYYGQVGTLSARLQAGSPPANPRLVALIEEARRQLQVMAGDVEAMTRLARDIADSGSVANFLRESTIAAFRVPGAVEEDHEALADVQDAIDRLLVQIDRQLTIAREEVDRQSGSLAGEERNIRTLSIAVQRGGMFGGADGDAMLSPASLGDSMTAPTALSGERPLVTIRFDRPNVSYERALFQAVNQALERAPGAAFEVVAVSPASGGTAAANQAQRRAEAVLREINNLGVPASRLGLSATVSQSAAAPEVRVLIR